MKKEDFDNLRKLKAEADIWRRALKRQNSAELSQKIERHIKQITALENKITEYILNLPDPQLRSIVYMRSIEGLDWNTIASQAGGGNTEDSVRKAYARFINRL